MDGDRVTLRDVAKEAGVSLGTVSLALRRVGHVNQETALRIREISERMGYRPDPSISRLASKRFKRDPLAQNSPIVIVGKSLSSVWISPTFSYGHAMEEKARELGYHPVYQILKDKEGIERLQRQWHARGCLGVVLAQVDTDVIDRVDWSGFSVVSIGGQLDNTTILQVRPDVARAVEMATEKALAAHKKRIGYAMLRHPGGSIGDDDIRYGVAASLIARGKVQTDIPILHSPISDQESFIEWVKRYRPDVVIGFPAVINYYLDLAGIRVPEDLAVVFLAMQQPSAHYASCFEDPDSLAQLAVEALDELIRRGRRGPLSRPRKILVRPIWLPGPSLPGV